jgi:hypothetical protein
MKSHQIQPDIKKHVYQLEARRTSSQCGLHKSTESESFQEPLYAQTKMRSK